MSCYTTQINSTALRFISSLTSMYFCVTAMLRCPARLAKTRTPMPLLAKCREVAARTGTNGLQAHWNIGLTKQERQLLERAGLFSLGRPKEEA